MSLYQCHKCKNHVLDDDMTWRGVSLSLFLFANNRKRNLQVCPEAASDRKYIRGSGNTRNPMLLSLWAHILSPLTGVKVCYEVGLKHSVDRVLGCFSNRPNWDPHPLTRWRVCFAPLVRGGKDTLACGRGVGGVPIQTRGETLWYSRYICGLKSTQARGCRWSILFKDIKSALTPSLPLPRTLPFPIEIKYIL